MVFTVGCEDELNIEPQQDISAETALEDEESVLNLLVGVYRESSLGAGFGGVSQITSDLLGSAFNEVSWHGTSTNVPEFLLKDILSDNFNAQSVWNIHYQIINQANIVLDHLDLITSSVEVQQSAEGEAKFLRAMAYFDLVKLYGLPYEDGMANDQMGVPIRIEGIVDFDEDLSIARNSVAEVYNLIISDLNDAYILLPAFNDFFADRYSAKAFLARVYLQQQNYNAARDAANDVIENSGHGLNPEFNSVFNNDSDSVEDLFALNYTNQDFTNQFIVGYASRINGGAGGNIAIEQGYLNLFDDPTNDERASFFYISADNGQLLTSKYTNQFGNIALIRLAEMHLIRAECNYRLGTSIGLDPLSEINTIRARSGATAHGSLTLDLILNERRLELGFEGFLIHDIKRTMGSIEGYPFDADNLVLPIPQSEMDTNQLIEQNPGYSD